MPMILNTVLSFLGGLTVGVFIPFISNWLTDWRRKREEKHASSRKFEKVRAVMPALIAEMQQDTLGNPHTRYLFALPHESVRISTDGPRFVYAENKHPNLKELLVILAGHGYITDVTEASRHIPRYLMSEAFVEMLVIVPTSKAPLTGPPSPPAP